MYQKLFDAVESYKDVLLKAERDLNSMPELGFREWKTHAYMKARFEELGYELTELGDIPGFYTDVDTGRPGPKIVVFAELDGLPCPGHPFADPETTAAHACGHHCQCAGLIGVAAALKAEGALDEMCGSIRLFTVPAEEGVSAAYREELRKSGKVRYFAGKPEVLYRGLLDDVDIAMMVHLRAKPFKMSCPTGTNGNVRKKATFIGRSAHAGGSPHKGINALYAATTALSAANALRETFREKDTVRMHPIITKGGNVVNAIPDEVIVENMVRGGDYEVVGQISRKVNLAYAGSAAAMGCRVYFDDVAGSAPRLNDKNLMNIFHDVALNFFKEEEMEFDKAWGKSSSDMGDISNVIPSVHPYIGGAVGVGHSTSFLVEDAYTACVTGPKIICGVLKNLLTENAALAKKVIAEKKVPYASKEEFFRAKDALDFVGDGVVYNEDGTVTLKI